MWCGKPEWLKTSSLAEVCSELIAEFDQCSLQDVPQPIEREEDIINVAEKDETCISESRP